MDSDPDALGRAVLRKVRRRLIPFMLLLYLTAYLDRINVSFANLQMSRDLGFSDAVYGFGAGLFFIGYFLFEVPSNLLLERIGARRWIARIMVSWGILSSAMMTVEGKAGFYVLRFLLGVAEAGFFPGMILYLTYWFPRAERARAMSQFITAAMIAWVLGGPLSGWLLDLDGRVGLRGWQWMFLLEGIPSVICGIAVWVFLPDRPSRATWLGRREYLWLEEKLAAERAQSEGPGRRSIRALFADRRVWLLCAAYFLITVGGYGLSLWLPKLLKGMLAGRSNLVVGTLSAIPYGFTALGMIWIGSRSDRTGERRWHVAAPSFLAAAGLALAAWVESPVLAVAALSLAAVGLFGCLGPFWAMTTGHLSAVSAAGGIALINSIGNLGGFVGPTLVGVLKADGGSFAAGFLVLAVVLAAAGLLVLSLSVRSATPASEPPRTLIVLPADRVGSSIG